MLNCWPNFKLSGDVLFMSASDLNSPFLPRLGEGFQNVEINSSSQLSEDTNDHGVPSFAELVSDVSQCSTDGMTFQSALDKHGIGRSSRRANVAGDSDLPSCEALISGTPGTWDNSPSFEEILIRHGRWQSSDGLRQEGAGQLPSCAELVSSLPPQFRVIQESPCSTQFKKTLGRD
jgi:hypothetical protein